MENEQFAHPIRWLSVLIVISRVQFFLNIHYLSQHVAPEAEASTSFTMLQVMYSSQDIVVLGFCLSNQSLSSHLIYMFFPQIVYRLGIAGRNCNLGRNSRWYFWPRDLTRGMFCLEMLPDFFTTNATGISPALSSSAL
jgi:hypothetical protein